MRQMKDSGIEWVGDIPATWKTNTVFQLFTQVKNKNTDLQEQNLLSLSYGKIKRRSIDTTDGLLPESFDGYNIIEADDIVLRLTDLQNDHKSLRVGLATERGIVTSAYLTIRNRSESLAKYLYYYLHSFDIAKGFYGMGAGVRQGLNWDGMKWLKILTPSVLEQQRIVAFLDSECDCIDAVIEQTRTSIEEYKKLKQAVITQAVTKGILSVRPMEESGLEIITQIPSGWKVFAIKHLCKIPITDGTHMTPEYSDAENGSPFLSSKDISSGYIDWSEIKYITKELHEELQKSVSPQVDDILLAKNGTTGVAAIVEDNKVFDVYVTIAVIRANQQLVHPRFLLYSINSNLCKRQFDDHLKGIGVPNLHLGTINNTKVFLPNLDEQAEIIRYLDDKIPEIDSLIRKKQQLLDSLELYKKSFIFEYVTGKKEVPA